MEKILTRDDFKELRRKALEIKREADTIGHFLGGKVQVHYRLIGLLRLHIDEHGNLNRIELPDGSLIAPPK
jgi:hypothetical protein